MTVQVNLIELIGLLVVIGGALIGVSHWIFKEIARVRGDLQSYKLHVAQTYVSQTHMKDVESRLVTLMEKIEDKVDDLWHYLRRDGDRRGDER